LRRRLARKVITRVFDLEEDDEDDGLEAAALGLAEAFATIEQYREYIPTRIYNGMAECMREFCDPNWLNEPEVMRKALPHILRAAIENEESE